MINRKESLVKRFLEFVLALGSGLVVAGLAMLAAPATATPPSEHKPVCATWIMRGATGAYPNVSFGGAPAGSEVKNYSATLVKPADGVQPGVEFAAFDLDVEATADTTVQVDYALSGEAASTAGAIRLFGYTAKNANTLTTAPQYQESASGAGGTLTFVLPSGAKLGTLGLVYDASNDAKGSVTFSGMKIGDRKVRFTTCPKPESSSASPAASQTSTSPATTKPAETTKPASSRPVTEVPEETTAPPAAGLPITGPGLMILLGIGGAVTAAGLVLVALAHRRKTHFTA